MSTQHTETLTQPALRPKGVLAYQSNIFEGLYTTLIGLTVTFKSFWRKPSTVQYPDVDMTAPFVPNPSVVDAKKHIMLNPVVTDRFRGLLDVTLDNCTGCGVCAKACPIDCIEVEGIKIEGHKGKRPIYFNIDMAKCMYCGLCVEPCPTEAIHFTRFFEKVTPEIGDLFLRFVPVEEGRRIKKQGEMEAEAAAKAKAEKAAAKAAEQVAGGDKESAKPAGEKKEETSQE